MTLCTHRWGLLAVLAVGAVAAQAGAQTILYDHFDRTDGSTVRNTAPVTGPNWAGSPGFKTLSNRLTSDTTSSGGHVLTANFGTTFANSPAVFSLSADVFMTSTMVNTGDSWQIGFNNATNASAGANRSLLSSDAYGGQPAIVMLGTGRVLVRAANTTIYDSGAGNVALDVEHNLTVILDTTVPNWTVQAMLDETVLDLNGVAEGTTYTFATNPTITYAAIASNIDNDLDVAATYLDNITLTVIPEPGSLSLLAGAAMLLLSRRRQRSV